MNILSFNYKMIEPKHYIIASFILMGIALIVLYLYNHHVVIREKDDLKQINKTLIRLEKLYKDSNISNPQTKETLKVLMDCLYESDIFKKAKNKIE
jgi:hypothetical protein